MNTNQFCGASTLEEYESLIKIESTIQDSEMIARGEGPLFVSIYDRLYLNDKKSKYIPQSDASIVDNIFKSKLSKEPKPKAGLASIIKNHTRAQGKRVVTKNESPIHFIVSLFK